jgi:hypothetical protein
MPASLLTRPSTTGGVVRTDARSQLVLFAELETHPSDAPPARVTPTAPTQALCRTCGRAFTPTPRETAHCRPSCRRAEDRGR